MNQRVMPHARNQSFGVSVRAFLVGLAILLGGCAEPGVKLQPPPIVEDTKAVLQDYVGLSESQARDLARGRDTPFRVVTSDGVSQMVMFDFIRGRINGGVVVAYVVEGAKQRPPKVPSP